MPAPRKMARHTITRDWFFIDVGRLQIMPYSRDWPQNVQAAQNPEFFFCALCTTVVQNPPEPRRILFGYKRLKKHIKGKIRSGFDFFVPPEPFVAISFPFDLAAAPPRCASLWLNIPEPF